MRNEVLTVVNMSMVFWILTPCGPIDANASEELKMFLRNIYLQVRMALQPRTQTSTDETTSTCGTFEVVLVACLDTSPIFEWRNSSQ
jgi:hypothetical protein